MSRSSGGGQTFKGEDVEGKVAEVENMRNPSSASALGSGCAMS